MADIEITNTSNVGPEVMATLRVLVEALNARLSEIEQRIESVETG